jgi:hypothetical protein
MKRFWIVTSLTFVMLSAVTAFAQADDTGEAGDPGSTFAHRFALDLDGQAAYYTMTLPASVYAASQTGDLGDLRVFNGAGEPVPYSFDAPPAAHTKTVLKQQSVPWFALPGTNAQEPDAPLGVSIAADGSLHATSQASGRADHHEDIVDIGRTGDDASGHINALLVHVRRNGYQGRVSVEQSDDLHDWQPLAQAQIIHISSGRNPLVQERIALDGLSSRYLRLRWLDNAPEIASIQIELQGTALRSGGEASWQWSHAVHVTQGKVAGEYFFETDGAYPVERLRLNLPQPNTIAHAQIDSRADASASWQTVVQGTLFRLEGKTAEQHNPPLELSADTDRQWRIVVDTGNGGLGRGLPSVAVGWRPAVLTFVARGAAPFTLAVGNPGMRSNAVSRDALLMGSTSDVAAAHIGQRLPQPKAPPAATSQDGGASGASQRYVLWGALLLAVGVLGVMAWRLVGREKR